MSPLWLVVFYLSALTAHGSTTSSNPHGSDNATEPRSPALCEARSYEDKEGQLDANVIMDFLIAYTAQSFVDAGRNVIQLPELNAKGSGITLHLFNGHLGNMSTMYRTSEATLSQQGGVISLSVAMALRYIDIGYDFKGKFLLSPYKGHGTGSVASHSFRLKCSLHIAGDKCQFVIDSMATESLNGVTIKVDGFGIFNPAVNLIIKTTLKPKTIRKLLDERLGNRINGSSTPCPEGLFGGIINSTVDAWEENLGMFDLSR